MRCLRRARLELVDQIEAVEAKLTDATRQIDDQSIELVALPMRSSNGLSSSSDSTPSARHLELDLAVKDDYIADLRGEFTELLNRFNALLYKYEVLHRSRPVKMGKLLRRMLHPFRDESDESED